MIFKVVSNKLKPLSSTWAPKELELEKIIFSQKNDESVLESSIFGEPLLILCKEVKANHRKRADILALDRAGNSVIIELKRDAGREGV